MSTKTNHLKAVPLREKPKYTTSTTAHTLVLNQQEQEVPFEVFEAYYLPARYGDQRTVSIYDKPDSDTIDMSKKIFASFVSPDVIEHKAFSDPSLFDVASNFHKLKICFFAVSLVRIDEEPPQVIIDKIKDFLDLKTFSEFLSIYFDDIPAKDILSITKKFYGQALVNINPSSATLASILQDTGCLIHNSEDVCIMKDRQGYITQISNIGYDKDPVIMMYNNSGDTDVFNAGIVTLGKDPTMLAGQISLLYARTADNEEAPYLYQAVRNITTKLLFGIITPMGAIWLSFLIELFLKDGVMRTLTNLANRDTEVSLAEFYVVCLVNGGKRVPYANMDLTDVRPFISRYLGTRIGHTLPPLRKEKV